MTSEEAGGESLKRSLAGAFDEKYMLQQKQLLVAETAASAPRNKASVPPGEECIKEGELSPALSIVSDNAPTMVLPGKAGESLDGALRMHGPLPPDVQKDLDDLINSTPVNGIARMPAVRQILEAVYLEADFYGKEDRSMDEAPAEGDEPPFSHRNQVTLQNEKRNQRAKAVLVATAVAAAVVVAEARRLLMRTSSRIRAG